MGIKQRLLAYLFLLSRRRKRVDGYEKDNFSYRFHEYQNLAMWKVRPPYSDCYSAPGSNGGQYSIEKDTLS